MAARSGRLNVVITREGSLSPRSKSGSASPRRTDPVEEQVPPQVNYEDVIRLFRKWQDAERNRKVLRKEVTVLRGGLSIGTEEAARPRGKNCTALAETKIACVELQERLRTVKGLLDASRLESAKLSRVVVAKSRKLDDARREAARVPRLAATVDRLQRDKGAVESALGEEGRKVEEEQRRSKAWRAQADKASLQVVQCEERCRILSNENHELREELERTRVRLKEVERQAVVARVVSEELRLKRIETGLLVEELGAVRQDCGRLVQLISSTKEYAQFRRIWDDSGSLTRLNNSGAARSFSAATMESSYSGLISGGSTAETSCGEGATAAAVLVEGGAVQKSGARAGSGETAAAAAASTDAADCWRQAMRSEWSSPISKILGTVTNDSATPRRLSATVGAASVPKSTAVTAAGAAPATQEDCIDEDQAAQRDTEDKGGRQTSRRAGNTTGPAAGGAPRTAKRVSFSQESDRSSSTKVEPGGIEEVKVLKGWRRTETKATGCAASGVSKGTRGCAVETEVVHWGRVDLMSGLYPPPGVGEARTGTAQGSIAHVDLGTELSMWVPQEAAWLCRSFVRDFDGYSGLPLDVEQHRLLRALLLGLNAAWRESEKRHVERLTKRYRSELKAAQRRLDMRKPMEMVVAERAAKRRMSSPAPFCLTGAGTLSGTPVGRRARWGADGRRIRGHVTAGCGSSAASLDCHPNGGLSQGFGEGKVGAARSRTKRLSKLDGKRPASEKTSSSAAAIRAPFAKFEAGSRGKEAWPESSSTTHDRSSRFLEDHQGAREGGDGSCWEASLASTTRESTSIEDDDRCLRFDSRPLSDPRREKTRGRRRKKTGIEKR